MDYCAPCRRHLNGALICAGCGAPATGPGTTAAPTAAAPDRPYAHTTADDPAGSLPGAGHHDHDATHPGRAGRRAAGRPDVRTGSRRSGRRPGRLVVSVVGLAVAGLGVAALAANGTEGAPADPAAGAPVTLEPRQGGAAPQPSSDPGRPEATGTAGPSPTQRPTGRTASPSPSKSAATTAPATSRAPEPAATSAAPVLPPGPSTAPATTPSPSATGTPKPTATCTQFLFWCT